MIMDKQFATTSDSPQVVLFVTGDLRLKGQDALEVVAKSDDPEDLSFESQDDQVTIRCNSDCGVRVPRAARVHLAGVNGNAFIKALDAELAIDRIDGNLELRNVGPTRVGQVSGNLFAKNVDGDLSIERVDGEISARRVQGDFAVSGRVSGNLNLNDIGGSASASVDGNISLRLDPAPGHDYRFECHGNVFCRLSSETSAEISVPKAAQVMVNLPGIHAAAPVQAPYAYTLGEGDAKIILSAEGNVVMDTHAPDWDMEDFDIDVGSEVEGMADAVSQQISQQVESQMKMMEEQLNAQMASLSMRLKATKLSEEQAQRIEERARETSERAATRAQERIRRAQEKMEQKMAMAQRKMEAKKQLMERASHRSHRHWNINIPTPPAPGAPTAEPVSEDERLIILRMLEEKKISSEEAEQLLSALEGNS
jgi:hypothetical protein